MKHISVLIKPASGLCNIRCRYCFYANVSSLREVQSYGKMTLTTMEKMIDQIYIDLEDGDELSLTFQGGEPTLAGLPYFEKLTNYVGVQGKKVKVHYAIQTNGMLINEKWCHFLKKYQFLVGLSIDGNPMYHDLNRVDVKGRGTYHRVMLTKQLFDQYQVDYNVLCVLTNPLAKQPKKVFQFMKKENIKYIQFIPCLDDFYVEKRSSYALTPKRFASFYRTIFQLWLEEFRQGNYISVKLFDDVVNLFCREKITACGILGNCQVQYVIEADGSVYPCDFYVLDEYRLGFIQEKSLRELFEQENARRFVCEKRQENSFCATCPFKAACGGGCKRMKDAMYVDEQGAFCGYQSFLKLFLPHLEEIVSLSEKMIG